MKVRALRELLSNVNDYAEISVRGSNKITEEITGAAVHIGDDGEIEEITLFGDPDNGGE